MFPPLGPASLLPPIKNNRNWVCLSLAIERQLSDELFPSRLDVASTMRPNLPPHTQQIVAIDDQVFGHG